MTAPTLAYTGAPETPEWFAARRSGITATDVVAIVDAYEPGYRWARTAMHVWLDKRGKLPPDGGASHFAEAGHRLEPVIAEWWADDHGTTVAPTGVWRRDGWKVASPDRDITTCPDGDGPCWLEVKNRNAYVAGQWSDDVPDDVLAQVSWQMAVTGRSHVHVAALIGGNTPRWHRIDRDPQLEAYLTGEASRVWGHVQDGTPPPVDPSAALARLLDALHPDRSGERVLDVERATALYRQAKLGTALERRGKVLRENARDAAVALLGDAEFLAVQDSDKPLARYGQRSRTGIDLAKIKAEMPKLHTMLESRGYLATTTYRELRWTKKVGDSLGE